MFARPNPGSFLSCKYAHVSYVGVKNARIDVIGGLLGVFVLLFGKTRKHKLPRKNPANILDYLGLSPVVPVVVFAGYEKLEAVGKHGQPRQTGKGAKAPFIKGAVFSVKQENHA